MSASKSPKASKATTTTSRATKAKSPKPTRQSAAEARAAAQAGAAAAKAARQAALAERFGEEVPGQGLIRAAIGATALFCLVTALDLAVASDAVDGFAIVVDLLLFAVGCALFLLALYRGAQRSREADMTMAGWWFLIDSAPPSVRRTFLGCLAVQTVVGFVAAGVGFSGMSIDDKNPMAFAVLAPMLGIAMSGLWGADHGWFPPRRSRG